MGFWIYAFSSDPLPLEQIHSQQILQETLLQTQQKAQTEQLFLIKNPLKGHS